MLYQVALQNNLGERLTAEYEQGCDGQRYVAQIYELHFEIRLRRLPASRWGWTLQAYAHPTQFINGHPPR